MSIVHFGANLRGDDLDKHRLTRDNYIYYNSEGNLTFYYWSPQQVDSMTEEQLADKIEQRLNNFDLNMAFYSSLDSETFNAELDLILDTYPDFQKVINISEYKGKSGVYILVLDKYKQMYIGKGKDIYTRIRQHWVTKVHFDRLIFGSEYSSRLSIDSFRALDTSRIYVAASNDGGEELYELEHYIHSIVDDKYLANRVAGGRPEMSTMPADFFRFRNLTSF